ncbi:MAG: type II toxin-antitoxin system VapB family antitoxin [Chthoniobacteraceae bacterium]
MKMTMHIDEDVLAEVMKITGAKSKTKAVEQALEEMVRRHQFSKLSAVGLGLTAEELKNVWEDPFPEETARSLRMAEEPPKPRAKRSRR